MNFGRTSGDPVRSIAESDRRDGDGDDDGDGVILATFIDDRPKISPLNSLESNSIESAEISLATTAPRRVARDALAAAVKTIRLWR